MGISLQEAGSRAWLSSPTVPMTDPQVDRATVAQTPLVAAASSRVPPSSDSPSVGGASEGSRQ